MVVMVVVLHDVMVHFHVVHLVGVVQVLEHRFAVVVAVRHDAALVMVLLVAAHHVIRVGIYNKTRPRTPRVPRSAISLQPSAAVHNVVYTSRAPSPAESRGATGKGVIAGLHGWSVRKAPDAIAAEHWRARL